MAVANHAVLRRLVTIAMVMALAFTLTPAPSAEAATVARIRDRVYELINNSRRAHGLRPLKVNTKIQYWAQDHARDMASRRTFYHDPRLALEVNKVKPPVWAFGENVGYTWAGRRAPRRIHKMFMRSPLHRANILKKRFTHMGLGVVRRDGAIYVVERFVDLRR